MSTSSLSADAAQLTDALRATSQQIARFSKSGPQPQRPLQDTEPGDDQEDDSDARAEIASDIHESLKQHEESLELLSLEIEDLNVQGIRLASTNTDEGRSWIQLVARVSRLGEDLRQYGFLVVVSLFEHVLTSQRAGPIPKSTAHGAASIRNL